MSFIDIVWKTINIMSTAIVFTTVVIQFADRNSWFNLRKFYNKLETIRLWQQLGVDDGLEEDLLVPVRGNQFKFFIVKNSEASNGYHFANYLRIYIHINDELVCKFHCLESMSLFSRYALSYKSDYNPDEIDLIVEEAYKQVKTEMRAYYDKKIKNDRKSFF